MVNKNKKEKEGHYKCSKCGLYYKDKKLADKCKAWCSKHNSCNIEIIKNSVKI